MVVMAPKDEQELRDMLYTAIEYKDGPIALRYPRANSLGVEVRPGFRKLEIGKGVILRGGKHVAVLAVGNLVPHALEAAEILAAEGIEAEVVNMRFVKPIDDELIRLLAQRIDAIVTVEDNVIQGGFGSGILESISKQGLSNIAVKLHGLPNDFVDHGTPNELYNILKLDASGIADVVREFLLSRQNAVTPQLTSS
jgi:1-deoxy-D-xylulose-5-phosphate synthase